jgi:hypothetical protein
MKDRQQLLETLSRSTEIEGSLVALGIILLDIRDLLQSLQPKNIIVATEENPHCNCATTKTDGESEHWPQCRYA